MENLEVNKKSLHGRAQFIRNMLRGGIAVDDDKYPLSMFRESIVTVSAELINQELMQREARGESMPIDLLVDDELTLGPDDIETQLPVVYKICELPDTALWKAGPAITSMKARQEPTDWSVATNEQDALIKAVSRPYLPGNIAYWIEGKQLRVVLPVKRGLMREPVKILYVPSRLELFADGTPRDLFEDEFPLPDRLWETVWQTVYQRAGGKLVQTSPNRDEVNNGADTTVVPPRAQA